MADDETRFARAIRQWDERDVRRLEERRQQELDRREALLHDEVHYLRKIAFHVRLWSILGLIGLVVAFLAFVNGG